MNCELAADLPENPWVRPTAPSDHQRGPDYQKQGSWEQTQNVNRPYQTINRSPNLLEAESCQQDNVGIDPLSENFWTPQEREQILLYQLKFGNKWAQIAKMFPGKTQGAVKNKFYSTIRKGLKNINLFIREHKSRQKHKAFKDTAIMKAVQVLGDRQEQKLGVPQELMRRSQTIIKGLFAAANDQINNPEEMLSIISGLGELNRVYTGKRKQKANTRGSIIQPKKAIKKNKILSKKQRRIVSELLGDVIIFGDGHCKQRTTKASECFSMEQNYASPTNPPFSPFKGQLKESSSEEVFDLLAELYSAPFNHPAISKSMSQNLVPSLRLDIDIDSSCLSQCVWGFESHQVDREYDLKGGEEIEKMLRRKACSKSEFQLQCPTFQYF